MAEPVVADDDTLSDEQRAVIACDGALIAVQAYAGCGKTTTLEHYVRRRPKQRFLYLCFNRSVQQSAEARFASYDHVDCRTIDSMALEHANSGGNGNRNRAIKELIRPTLESELPDDDDDDTRSAVAAGACRLLVDYCADGDDREELTAARCDALVARMKSPVPIALKGRGTPRRRASIACAVQTWQRLRAGSTSWTAHDVNRKMMHVDGATWHAQGYDRVLVDECQDLSPLMLSIVMACALPKLFVGDRHQHIYSFMGTVDAFKMLDERATDHFRLSISYRFGAAIADAATRLIRQTPGFGNHALAAVRGAPNHADGVSCTGVAIAAPKAKSEQGKEELAASSRYAMLCRTNVSVFVQAVKAAEANRRVHVYGKQQLTDRVRSLAAALGTDRWRRTLMAVRRDNDWDTLALMRLIEQQGDAHVTQAIATLDRRHVDRECDADVVLSTVHKAKGMEWSLVKINDDVFASASPRFTDADDVNLAYVACTRAQHHLRLPPNGYALLYGGATPQRPADDVSRWRSTVERRRKRVTDGGASNRVKQWK